MKNNPATRTLIAIDKLTNAATLYPAKGLKGNKNANFYEFLTMGTVPYLIGSGMLMGVFNAANKYFAPFAKTKASALGKKNGSGCIVLRTRQKYFKILCQHSCKNADWHRYGKTLRKSNL